MICASYRIECDSGFGAQTRVNVERMRRNWMQHCPALRSDCEIEGPKANVILAGLFSSTAPNLVILPTLASRNGRFEAEAAQR
jgi:hypothetical protein